MKRRISFSKLLRAAVLLSVVFCIAAVVRTAAADDLYDSRTECFYKATNGGGVLLVRYTGNRTTYTVPGEIAGRKVVGLAGYAFYGTPVKDLTLPKGVTVLEDYALACSGLKSVTCRGRLEKIGDCAFENLQMLTTVTVEGDIGKIGNGAFRGCAEFRSVSAEGRIGTIGNEAFMSCGKLKTLSASGITAGVGTRAFYGCGALTSVPVLGGRIGEEAFRACSALSGVELDKSVTRIDSYAFFECKALKGINIPDTVVSFGCAVFSPSTMMTVGKNSAGFRYASQLPEQGYRERGGSRSRAASPWATAEEKADAVVARLITEDMSPYDRAKAMHDYLCRNANYDYSYQYYGAEGVLLFGKGVCSSYSYAYQLLMERAGVYCACEGGTDHAYNILYLDGEWYYTDVTWDDGTDDFGYAFFLVPYYALEGVDNHECFLRMHKAEGYRLNYYYKNGMLDEIVEDIAVRVQYGDLAEGKTQTSFRLTSDRIHAATGDYDGYGILRRLALFAAMNKYGYMFGDEYVNLDYSFDLASETVTVRIPSGTRAAERDAGCVYAASGDRFTLPSPLQPGRKGTAVWRIRSDLDKSSAYYPGYFLTLTPGGKVRVIGNSEMYQIWIDLEADVRYDDGGRETVVCHFCYDGRIDDSVLRLSAGKKTVESNAFSGGDFKRVVVPAKTEKVCSRAFGRCPALNSVRIMGKDTRFDPNAFSEDWNDITWIVPAGSWAEQWAIANGVQYVIDG